MRESGPNKTSPIKTERRIDPKQDRAAKTIDQVLAAAADLLAADGFEKLTTNGICKRAGLTPPALYRYFPNKYAVVKELGERLMARQNQVIENWVAADVPFDQLEQGLVSLMAETVAVTQDTPAGAYIMRSLHASPVLASVRLASHRLVAQQLTDWALIRFHDHDPKRVYQMMRTAIEVSYAGLEMMFDEPQCDPDQTIADLAAMVGFTVRQLAEPV